MLDAPIDGWYAWLGLAVVATLPTAPPPDANNVAATVDTVAAAAPPAAARYRLGADAAQVTPDGVSLRSDGGTASATFAVGSTVPVDTGTRLAGVALGDPPGRAFETRGAFAAAVGDARNASNGDRNWTAGDTLYARHVSWGETDVTLVLVA